MLFKNSLMRGDTPVANAGPSSACKLEYRLPGGRTVQVEEFCFRVSTLGFLAGREERIREKIVEEIPKLLRAQFWGNYVLSSSPSPKGPCQHMS